MSLIAGTLILSACNPAKEEVDNNTVYSSESDILNGITFTQYSDAEYTTQAADGNYIYYQTNPGRQVQVYNYYADGTMNLLASGASGKFSIKPKRGSQSNQPVFIRTFNSDGSVTNAQTTINVYVQQELEPEIRLLASNAYGSKIWKWDTSATDGVVWGNMGYCGGSGADVALQSNGKWWGVTSEEEFLGQLIHTDDGAYHGDGSMDATMVFSDEGIVTCFDEKGDVIRQGTFNVSDFNPQADWRKGMLNTEAILWPYQINWKSNGYKAIPGEYEIVYLTADKMCLVYPDGGAYDALGNWGEASFWHFTSNSDIMGMAVGYEGGKDWTWDTEATDGVVWGNMGYCGGNGADVGISSNGKWWGVTSEEEFLGQLVHSADGAAHGDESMDAYMTLNSDGTIIRHAGDGSVINSGTFEIDESVACDWKVANLNTTAGTILWPYQINWKSNGYEACPTTFEMVYLTADKMCLVYPDGGKFNELGNWGEASFWHFKAK